MSELEVYDTEKRLISSITVDDDGMITVGADGFRGLFHPVGWNTNMASLVLDEETAEALRAKLAEAIERAS